MITVYKEYGKPFYWKISAKEWESEIMVSFGAGKAVCGGCGAVGETVFYCFYTRWVETVEDGAAVSKELVLFRCQCKCGKTHVVAPGELVIPYMRHSLVFVLAVLEAYVKRERSVRRIAAGFQIAVSTLYAWKDRFHVHCELLLGKLATASGEVWGKFEAVMEKSDFGKSLHVFVGTHEMCFLQAKERYHASRYFTIRGCLALCAGASP